jgi:hypothetical protein
MKNCLTRSVFWTARYRMKSSVFCAFMRSNAPSACISDESVIADATRKGALEFRRTAVGRTEAIFAGILAMSFRPALHEMFILPTVQLSRFCSY